MNQYIQRSLEAKIYHSHDHVIRRGGTTALLVHLEVEHPYHYVTLDNPIERDLAKNDPDLFKKNMKIIKK